LRASVYMINCDNVFDLLIQVNPLKSMDERGIHIDAHHPDSKL